MMFDQPVPGGPRPEDAVPSRPRRARLVRRIVLALVAGALVGGGVALQVHTWGSLGSESGGACGDGYRTACPRGMTPLMVGSIGALVVGVPLALVALFLRPRVGALVAVLAAVGGVFAGNVIFQDVHGVTLSVAWQAGFDSSDSLVSEGVWRSGPVLARARVDRITGYDQATGRTDWVLPLPGQDVVCGMSGGVAGRVGLVAYAPAHTSCGRVAGVDVTTGRQLWSAPLAAGATDGAVPDLVAADGSTAALVTPDAALGLDARTGRRLWSHPAPGGCQVGAVSAARGALVALAYCGTTIQVLNLDQATGATRWSTTVSQPDSGTQTAVVSTNPVVLNEIGPAPRHTETLRLFGPTGAPGPVIDVSEIDTPDGPVALDTDRHVFDAAPVWWTFADDGMIVGVTRHVGGRAYAVGYRASDGSRAWLTALPEEAVAVSGGNGGLSVVYGDQPLPVVESISVRDGSATEQGLIPDTLFGDETALLQVPGGYALVNCIGTNPHPPLSVLRR